jgi:hypothetical protein
MRFLAAIALLLLLLCCLTSFPASARILHGGAVAAPSTCGPDPTPAPAAARGYTCETFVDNFTSISTIDAANTLAPGFKWYTNNAWPGEASTMPQWQSFLNTLPDSYSIDANGLEFHVPQSENNRIYISGGAMLLSCGYAPGGGYVGQTFSNGWYADVQVTAATVSGAEDISWYEPTEFYTSTVSGVIFDELDNDGTTSHGTLWEWLADGSYTNTALYSHGFVTAWDGPNTYGMLVVPASQNGGNNLIGWYENDIYKASGSYAPSSGILVTVGTDHFCIILQSNYGLPETIRSVKVWQLPP